MTTSQYPDDLDQLIDYLPGTTRQWPRSRLVPLADAIEAVQAAVGTTGSPGPLLAALGASSFDGNGNLLLPGTSGTGVKVGDPAAFGWKDLIGSIQPRTQPGAGTPTLAAWRGGQVRTYFFNTNDRIDWTFHMPHDWVPGTDLFIHVHWGHHGTAISGSFVFDFYTTFARGFNQASNGEFEGEVNSTLNVGSLSIENTPRYRHRTDEIQLTASGGGVGLLDTAKLETDGLLLIGGKMTTIPTITGGATNLPSIFTIDLHYQSHGAGTTPGKVPGFYD